MNPRTKRIAALTPLLLVLCLSLSAFGCPKAYNAAAKASDTISSSVADAIQFTDTLYTSKQISHSEKDAIAGTLNNITDGNVEFRKQVRAIHARGGTKADYLKLAQSFVDSSTALLNSGVFHIKNEAKQAELNVYLQGIHTGLDTLISSMQAAQS